MTPDTLAEKGGGRFKTKDLDIIEPSKTTKC